MDKKIIAAAAIAGLAGLANGQIIIAQQNFENPAFAPVINADDNSSDYTLEAAQGNGSASQAVVVLSNVDDDGDVITLNAATNGTSLGFRSLWRDTRTDFFSGLSDGDFLGVTGFPFLAGREGDQAFQMQDTDGTMTLEFDTVDISANPGEVHSLSFLFGAEDGGQFEGEDRARAFLLTNIGRIDLLNFNADALSAFGDGSGGSFVQFDFDINLAVTSAILVFEFSGTASGEEVGIDNVVFSVPTPGAAAAFGVAGLGFARRRRA
ncbi:MAG: hypothetical protein AAGJ54_11675 [Planctomycetota bacterium]